MKRRFAFEIMKINAENSSAIERHNKAIAEMKNHYESEISKLNGKHRNEMDATLLNAKRHYESEIYRISSTYELQLTRNEQLLRDQRAMMETEFRRMQEEHVRLNMDKTNGSAEVARYTCSMFLPNIEVTIMLKFNAS